MTSTDKQRQKIIQNLEKLNKSFDKQNSIEHTLRNGIIYGIGFVIGSTVLAAATLSIFGHLFGDLPYVGPLIENSQS